MAELEDRPTGKYRSRSRSKRPSQPSPAPAVCIVGKADLVFDVAAMSCSRVSDVEFPSEATVQMRCCSLWPCSRPLASWALPLGSRKSSALRIPRATVEVARCMRSSCPRFGVG